MANGEQDELARGSTDLNKAPYEFLIATLPAVVLYFVGWGYLYFLLGDFGINIGELNFDTPTIFIYAFSPIYALLKSHWVIALLVTVCLVALILIIVTFFSHTWRVFRGMIGQLPVAVKILGSAIVFIFFLLTLIPFLQWAAFRGKTQIWKSDNNVVPIIEESSIQQLMNKDLSWRNDYIKEYMQCSDKGALRQIFADEKAYYLLCESTQNKNEGHVFEVRREGGLKSVRFVRLTG